MSRGGLAGSAMWSRADGEHGDASIVADDAAG